jgi:hypothetical protein
MFFDKTKKEARMPQDTKRKRIQIAIGKQYEIKKTMNAVHARSYREIGDKDVNCNIASGVTVIPKRILKGGRVAIVEVSVFDKGVFWGELSEIPEERMTVKVPIVYLKQIGGKINFTEQHKKQKQRYRNHLMR